MFTTYLKKAFRVKEFHALHNFDAGPGSMFSGHYYRM